MIVTRIHDAIVYGIAWQAIGAFSIPIVIALAVFLARYFGIRRALEIAGGVGAVLAAFTALRRSRQEGWSEREARLETDNRVAIDAHRDILNETSRMPDADLDRVNAPWVRGAPRADRR